MDADNSGSVSLEEFLTVMASEVDESAEEPMSVEKLADDM
jgi:Ca2+-binding EF-hand superfamily protein